MRYLNEVALAGLSAESFGSRSPYPWINPGGLLTDEGYESLLDSLPDAQLFERRFGEARRYGQRSHDRLALEYRRDLPVPRQWHEFVAELSGAAYRDWLAGMVGTPDFRLSFHWHYTPCGCSVSPHCDAVRKLGSHIFYFNREADWDPEWGGDTLILDDEGMFSRKSAPAFTDFPRIIRAESSGNRSLLFSRRGNSWHGVQELQCPPGVYRKVFIVVINRRGQSGFARLRRLLDRRS